ncbi:MAG: hypothetical protein LBH91_08590 [Prevotellaceae bacterium]|jgi:hypothetical protein|nr:hypothetical protein [Prevotellaceae bacterium]
MSLQNKIISRKALIFLLCLVISTVVWLINNLVKEYTCDVPYKVCVHSSVNNIESLCAENIMYVKVVAKGYYIMSHRWNMKELNVDIKKVKLSCTVDEHNVNGYTLSTALIQNAVREAIGDAVRMEAIITEELSFSNDN